MILQTVCMVIVVVCGFYGVWEFATAMPILSRIAVEAVYVILVFVALGAMREDDGDWSLDD